MIAYVELNFCVGYFTNRMLERVQFFPASRLRLLDREGFVN